MPTPPPFFRTPWGAPQTAKEIAPGIWHTTTASHGGFYLESEALARIPAAHLSYAAIGAHGFGPAWFEEDCAACCVIVAYPEHFGADQVAAAQGVVDHWINPRLAAKA